MTRTDGTIVGSYRREGAGEQTGASIPIHEPGGFRDMVRESVDWTARAVGYMVLFVGAAVFAGWLAAECLGVLMK